MYSHFLRKGDDGQSEPHATYRTSGPVPWLPAIMTAGTRDGPPSLSETVLRWKYLQTPPNRVANRIS